MVMVVVVFLPAQVLAVVALPDSTYAAVAVPHSRCPPGGIFFLL
jgi:hypothetical protein